MLHTQTSWFMFYGCVRQWNVNKSNGSENETLTLTTTKDEKQINAVKSNLLMLPKMSLISKDNSVFAFFSLFSPKICSCFSFRFIWFFLLLLLLVSFICRLFSTCVYWSTKCVCNLDLRIYGTTMSWDKFLCHLAKIYIQFNQKTFLNNYLYDTKCTIRT